MLNKFRKLSAIGLVALLACGIVFAANESQKQNAAEATEMDKPVIKEYSAAEMAKISEAFGHFIGRNLKNPTLQFDLEGIVKGIRDGAAGNPAPMSDEEYEQAMIALQKNALASLSSSNLQAADEFLAKNANVKGVVILEPGKLQYEITKEGTGAVVDPHTTVQLNYVGKFIDGTIFGSSKDSGGPVTLSLDQTVPGFSLGLVGMKEGEERRLWVHPDLGYGTAGHLPPNSLLIFEVELVKANAPAPFSKEGDDDSSQGDSSSDEQFLPSEDKPLDESK